MNEEIEQGEHAPGEHGPHAPAHQFEHADPTVIHHPEEDLTVLARWLKAAFEQGPGFWGSALALLILVVGGTAYLGSMADAPSATAQGWTELTQAKDAADLVRIADDHPGTPVEQWGRLQAALRFYYQGFSDLPNNRDAALPVLKKALDIFSQLARDTPKDDPLARAAALGMARTLEARNDLPGALEQYKKVSSTWPNTTEAEQATTLAKRLDRKDVADFYKQLYAYTKPTAGSLPPEPFGSGIPGMPNLGLGLPGNRAPVDAPVLPSTDLPTAPVPSATDKPAEAPATKTEVSAAKVEAPAAKVEAPAAKVEAPASKDELPNPLEDPAPKPEAPRLEAPRAEAPAAPPKL